MSTSGVRVMTWNLWWRFGPQWRERQPGILQTLRQVDADVVSLQEVWGADGTSQAHEFAAELGMHAAFTSPSLPPCPDPPETPDQRDVEIGLGLLSRWPISWSRQVEMPAKHRTPPPVALVAALDHPVGPLHVVVACLEWEPAYNEDRLAQGKALAALATDPALDGSLPVLVAGDLNAAPDSPVLRPLADTMTDAWSAGGGDPAAVTLSSSHPFAPVEAEELIDQRIDHIYVRPGHPNQDLTVTNATLAGHQAADPAPSDHHAVSCNIHWDHQHPPSLTADG